MESLISASRNTARKAASFSQPSAASAAGATRESGRRRRQGNASASGKNNDNDDGSGGGGGGAKRQRTSPTKAGRSGRGARNGSGGGTVAGPWVDEDRDSSAFHAVDFASAGYSPVRAGVPPPGALQLPRPSAAELAAADAEMSTAAASSGGGAVGAGAGGEGEGGVNTVTPSPEGNRAEGASPDGGRPGAESAQELQRKALSLTLDGCGLIRRIGKAMR